MNKKAYKLFFNVIVFIIFSYFMPGIAITNGPFGRIIIGIGYGLVLMLTSDVLHFFKLPETLTLKIIGGIVLTAGYLFLLATQFGRFFQVTKGYIGGLDLIIATTPKLFIIDNEPAMVITSALILVFCSIIFEKIKK